MAIEVLPIASHTATGCVSISVAAGRVSYSFSLTGVSLSVDTACSSSLVALRCVATADNPPGSAYGVSVIVSERSTHMFHAAGMMAPDGRCKTLDASADGYVRSEGVGGFGIGTDATSTSASYASLCGIGVNQDGRSSSLTAPNGPSQRQLIADVLRQSVGRSVRGMQMHGTGTALGDPIKVGGIAAALPRPVTLTAGKSAWGHSEGRAGLKGLSSACAGIEGRWCASILHLRAMNAFVASVLAGPSPRERSPMAEDDDAPSSCGCSSFAFQGTNAHAAVAPSDASSDAHASHARLWRSREYAVRVVSALVVWCDVRRTSSAMHYAVVVPSRWRDHGVRSQSLVPGAGYVEAMHESFRLASSRPTIMSDAVIYASITERTFQIQQAISTGTAVRNE